MALIVRRTQLIRSMPFRRSALSLLSLALIATACGNSDNPIPFDAPVETPATEVIYEVDELSERPFFELPFPNNLRLRADGGVDYESLKKQTMVLLHPFFDLTASNRMKGFSTIAPVYFRFSDVIDPTTLPADEAASVADDAALLLINIDPASSSYENRIPYRWKYSERGEGKYIGTNYLAIAPLAGFALRPDTTYGVLISKSLKDAAGNSLQRSHNLSLMLAESAPDENAAKAYETHQPLRDYLKSHPQFDAQGATLFTTGNPRVVMPKLRQVVIAQPVPQLRDMTETYAEGKYCQIKGYYDAPNFQQGAPPYLAPGQGGDIVFDENSLPVIQRLESIRFHLTIPDGPMPAEGWPILLYAHGTGGSYLSYTSTGFHKLLATKSDDGSNAPRFAMVGIDQVFHGHRKPEGNVSIFQWFNSLNPVEAISTMLQGGVDNVSLLRAMKSLKLESGVDSALQSHCEFKVDSSRVYYMGHSQGAFTGAPFLNVSPEIKGAVFSGARGHLSLGFVDRVRGASMKEIIELAFQERTDVFHPLLAVLQHALDPADPLNYAREIIRGSNDEKPPTHFFLVGGINDSYAPMAGIEALAIGLGTPLVHSSGEAPGPALEFAGLAQGTLPATNNTRSEQNRSVTSGLLLYQSSQNDTSCVTDEDCADQGKYYVCGRELRCTRDGHFAMFTRTELKAQITSFLVSHAQEGTPTISAFPAQ